MKYDVHSTVRNSLRHHVLESKSKLTFTTCIAFVFCLANIALWAQIKDSDEILHVDEAFKLHVYLDGTETIHAVWKIADDYYLYRHGFKLKTTDGANLEEPEIPSGSKTTDPYFGDVEIYYERVAISVRIRDIPEYSRVGIRFQGCAKNRYCFTPQIRWFEFREGAMVASEKEKTRKDPIESLHGDPLQVLSK